MLVAHQNGPSSARVPSSNRTNPPKAVLKLNDNAVGVAVKAEPSTSTWLFNGVMSTDAEGSVMLMFQLVMSLVLTGPRRHRL
jgi:hypothetical protein